MLTSTHLSERGTRSVFFASSGHEGTRLAKETTHSLASRLCAIPELNKHQRRELLHEDVDLNSRVSALGVLLIGQLLNQTKEFRKSHAFSRLSPATHAQFLTFVHSVRAEDSRLMSRAQPSRWYQEFERATPLEQIAILNASAGRGLMTTFSESTLSYLLTQHFEIFSPETLEDIASSASLYMLSNFVSACPLKNLSFFRTHREIFSRRLEAESEDTYTRLTHLINCVLASPEYIKTRKSDQAELCRMVSCLTPSEIISLFSPETEESLLFFTKLNNNLAQYVISLLKEDAPLTLSYFLSHLSQSQISYIALILPHLSIEAQRAFLKENPKSLPEKNLAYILDLLPEATLVEICQIDPATDLTDEASATAVFSNLQLIQILILGKAPAYLPFIERHIKHFCSDTLFSLIYFSQSPNLARHLLAASATYSEEAWVDIARAASYLLPKKEFLDMLIGRFRAQILNLTHALPTAHRDLKNFKTLSDETLSADYPVEKIQQIFQKAFEGFNALQGSLKAIKCIYALAEECHFLPTIESIQSSMMSAGDKEMFAEAKVKEMFAEAKVNMRSFLADGSEIRNSAIRRARARLGGVDTGAAPSAGTLSWLPEAISTDTNLVTGMYASLRASLDAIGVTMERLGDLDLCYDDLFEAGLRGDNLQGLTNEAELMGYLSLFQVLNDNSIPLNTLTEADLSLGKLYLLGLRAETLRLLSSSSEIVQWKRQQLFSLNLLSVGITDEFLASKAENRHRLFNLDAFTDLGLKDLALDNFEELLASVEKEALKRALSARALTETVLGRIGYTLEDLFSKGLRFDNLEILGIQDHRTLQIYMKEAA